MTQDLQAFLHNPKEQKHIAESKAEAWSSSQSSFRNAPSPGWLLEIMGFATPCALFQGCPQSRSAAEVTGCLCQRRTQSWDIFLTLHFWLPNHRRGASLRGPSAKVALLSARGVLTAGGGCMSGAGEWRPTLLSPGVKQLCLLSPAWAGCRRLEGLIQMFSLESVLYSRHDFCQEGLMKHFIY